MSKYSAPQPMDVVQIAGGLDVPRLAAVGRIAHFHYFRTMRTIELCRGNSIGVLRILFPLCRRPGFCFHRRMSKASLAAIVRYCDRLLRTARVQDYERAANGLQVENHGSVTRIAAAVDATLATVRLAVAAKADLLLVHHGLFWGPAHPWTGKRHELIRCLVEHNLAVYSSHLPLDAHPRLGNNALLCDALGLKKLRPFFFDHGLFLGFQAQARISRADLVRRLQRATGAKPRVIPGGPPICRRIGVVSGGRGTN